MRRRTPHQAGSSWYRGPSRGLCEEWRWPMPKSWREMDMHYLTPEGWKEGLKLGAKSCIGRNDQCPWGDVSCQKVERRSWNCEPSATSVETTDARSRCWGDVQRLTPDIMDGDSNWKKVGGLYTHPRILVDSMYTIGSLQGVYRDFSGTVQGAHYREDSDCHSL
jgi:hypothetical protein